jgi:hypothetical protein
MDHPKETTTERWRLYRRAREAGMSESEAYDRYLHPRSRISDESLAQELAETAQLS